MNGARGSSSCPYYIRGIRVETVYTRQIFRAYGNPKYSTASKVPFGNFEKLWITIMSLSSYYSRTRSRLDASLASILPKNIFHFSSSIIFYWLNACDIPIQDGSNLLWRQYLLHRTQLQIFQIFAFGCSFCDSNIHCKKG